jgi:hypothetical protein
MGNTLTTHTGFRFEVRRARPEDEPTVAEFFTHVTPEDLRFRFLGGVKEVSHERLVAMTRSDDSHIHNFLAFSIDGMLIAVATLACDPTDQDGESCSGLVSGWAVPGGDSLTSSSASSLRAKPSRPPVVWVLPV